MAKQTLRSGLTLIELIIVFGLLVLLLGTITMSIKSGLNLYNRQMKLAARQQISIFVLDKIVDDFRLASAILPTSNPTNLTLKVGSDTIEYSLVQNKIRRKQNSSTAYLTDENEIDKLVFGYPQLRLVEITVGGLTTRAALRNSL